MKIHQTRYGKSLGSQIHTNWVDISFWQRTLFNFTFKNSIRVQVNPTEKSVSEVMGKCSFFVHFWSKFFLGISGSRLGTGSVLGLWEGEIKRASHTKYGPIVSGGSRNNEEWTIKSLGKKWSFSHNFWHRFFPRFSKKFSLGNLTSSMHMQSFSKILRIVFKIGLTAPMHKRLDFHWGVAAMGPCPSRGKRLGKARTT